jgi:PKD repeat protein
MKKILLCILCACLFISPDGHADPGKLSVGPLIPVTWDEGCFYNGQCPVDNSATASCYHVKAGSGAVAMAQIMKYYSFPLHGQGEHSYACPGYGNLYANFSAAEYIWDSMPGSLSSPNEYVSQLVSQCGIAQEMQYGVAVSSSAPSSISNAFVQYFSYSSGMTWKWASDYSTAEWSAMLRAELDAGRPVLYCGDNNGNARHYCICDGYQGSDSFHFNWGWGGNYNNYFSLNNLVPGSDTLTFNQGALFGLVPTAIPPTANFSVDAGSGNSPLTVHFTDLSTGQPTSWKWYFGDGDSSTLQNPAHTYSFGGVYTVTLTVTNPGGSNTKSIPGVIHVNQTYQPFTMDFESTPDFSLTFDPWIAKDRDGQPTYGIQDHTFPHSQEPMAFIAFNPVSVTPSMSADPNIQPHGGTRFGGCFSAMSGANNDWFISPRIQLAKNGSFSLWVKSYTDVYGLEKFRIGVSVTDTTPGSFTMISGSTPVEAPLDWTKKTFDLSAYNDQKIYVAVQCVSADAFLFMMDDLIVDPGDTTGTLPSGASLDFEAFQNFTLSFDPWIVYDGQGGATYTIQNVTFPNSGSPMAWICFNPSKTTPPMTNMAAHGGNKLGACFSSPPPYNPNNKWLISPKIRLKENAKIGLWVQTYYDLYGLERYNIGVSTTGTNPSDFTTVSGITPESAPNTWTFREYSLASYAGQNVFIGIQCVSNDQYILMIDDINIGWALGTEDLPAEETVTVFPVPARDHLFVNFGDRKVRPVLILTDALGNTINTFDPGMVEGTLPLPLGDLPAGIYYLRISGKDRTTVKKIIIDPNQ